MDFKFNKPEGRKSFSDNAISTIRMNVVKHPDKTAVRFGDQSLKWIELWERSNRLANSLKALNLKKDDRVMIFLPNCMEYPEVTLGINKADLVSCGANIRLTGPEIAYQLSDSGARAVILKTREQLDIIMEIRGQTPALEHIIMIEEGADGGGVDYSELLSSGSDKEPVSEHTPDDIHVLMYTSGTTGKPKAAARTYKSDYHMANAVCHELGLNSDDTYLAVAPLYAAASVGYTFACLMSGGTLVILPAFEPDKVLKQIETYRPTWFFMVPIMYEWVLGMPDNGHDISSVRHVISCGAPLHNATARKMIDGFPGAEVSNWLGASEFGFISRYSYKDGLGKEGCVGKPLFDLELAVFDEEGRGVPKGEPGVLYGRGFSMWEGYLNKPEATAESFLDHEWGTVGDIAKLGDDGNFYIVDRKKDMIITGGINVYPVEVENVLMDHEAVADVVVIGVPDEKWGEAVKALVVPAQGAQPGEAEMIGHCRGSLAGFKVPKSVEFIDAVPRSLIGKALKNKLREKYWQGRDTKI